MECHKLDVILCVNIASYVTIVNDSMFYILWKTLKTVHQFVKDSIKYKYCASIFFFFFLLSSTNYYIYWVSQNIALCFTKKMFLTQVISPVQIGRTHFTPAAKEARWPKTISCYSRFGKHVSTWPISLKLMVSTINMVQSSWYINSRSHLRAVVQRHPVWYYHSHHH